MKLLSIVVPVYNASKYLAKCLDSILSQTYENLEIILINDSSTDDSEKICLDYLNRDNRILYFSIPNSGPANCRNYGLGKISGEYVAFVDSDDLIEPEMYKTLVSLLESDSKCMLAGGDTID